MCAGKAVVLGIVLAVCSSLAFGQSYDDLVAKARGGDANVDFKALRMGSITSKSLGVDPKLRAKLTESIKAKKNDEVAKTAEEILKLDFVNPNLHVVAARAYQASGDTKKYQLHSNIYLGLVNSILKDGNGESAKTAYEVISEDEVAAVLTALELQRTSQVHLEEEGHKYMVVTATDRATNATSKVYFNVDKAPVKAPEKQPQ
jgi:hypothetical protein